MSVVAPTHNPLTNPALCPSSYPPTHAPQPSHPHTQPKQGGEPLNIMTAAGPFTTSDTLDYEPLMALLSRVIKLKPDVLILTGPFVDVSQPLLSAGDVQLDDYDAEGRRAGVHGASYEMVFIERIVRDGLTTLFSTENGGDENLPTSIVLVPSLLDGHHECVYPQPPFGDRTQVQTPFFSEPLGVLNIPHSRGHDDDDAAAAGGGMGAVGADHRRRVYLMPNPCMFRVNEVLVGVTSQDVLFSLSKDEVSHNITGNRCARGRLISPHLLICPSPVVCCCLYICPSAPLGSHNAYCLYPLNLPNLTLTLHTCQTLTLTLPTPALQAGPPRGTPAAAAVLLPAVPRP